MDAQSRTLKHAADTLATLKVTSTRLLLGLDALRRVPVIADLYLQAVRLDCRLGDLLTELEAVLADGKRGRGGRTNAMMGA